MKCLNLRFKKRDILHFVILITLSLLLGIFTSCSSNLYKVLAGAAEDVSHDMNERYGTGSYLDIIKNGNSDLAPYYSKINKMYDDGVTLDERESRKNRLNSVYKQYKNGLISYNNYINTIREITNK